MGRIRKDKLTEAEIARRTSRKKASSYTRVDPPQTPCLVCKGYDSWELPMGGWVCAKCHPSPGNHRSLHTIPHTQAPDDTERLLRIALLEEALRGPLPESIRLDRGTVVTDPTRHLTVLIGLLRDRMDNHGGHLTWQIEKTLSALDATASSASHPSTP